MSQSQEPDDLTPEDIEDILADSASPEESQLLSPRKRPRVGETAISRLLAAERADPASQSDLPRASHVVTFCQALDALMGGGAALGSVTEIAGPAGSGKTQLCMQLALDAQLPRRIGGCDGQALYIDAEGAFSARRLRQMAAGVSAHVARVVQRLPAPRHERDALRAQCASDNLLRGVLVARPLTLADQSACLAGLDAFLSAHSRVKLVVLDSCSFHLRYGAAAAARDPSVRERLVWQLAQTLNAVAHRRNVAVVVTNQMTTKFDSPHGAGAAGGAGGAAGRSTTSRLTPALGGAWASACTRRIVLGIDLRPASGAMAGKRIAYLAKESVCFRDSTKATADINDLAAAADRAATGAPDAGPSAYSSFGSTATMGVRPDAYGIDFGAGKGQLAYYAIVADGVRGVSTKKPRASTGASTGAANSSSSSSSSSSSAAPTTS